MPDPALRAIVERLLRGDLRLHDLNTAILALRSRSDGRRAIKDMGDFIAHREDRFRGFVADETQDWFHLARSTAHYAFAKQPVDFDNLHPDLLKSLEITFSRMDTKSLARQINMKRSAAYRILQDIVGRAKIENGKTSVRINSQNETDLISQLASNLIVRPAFDDSNLFDEFVAALKSQGLLKKMELRNFAYLKPILSRYAVALMHKCVVTLKDGSRNELIASPNLTDHEIAVVAAVDAFPQGHKMHGVKMACNIYRAKVDPVESCDTALLLEPINWSEIHLEIAPDGKLCRLA
jgi:hypothetical protein